MIGLVVGCAWSVRVGSCGVVAIGSWLIGCRCYVLLCSLTFR